MIDLSRSAALLGEEGLNRLAAAHVLVVGVGGVGSWCAEALVRTGLGKITLMDDDRVAPSNVNRQCPATAETLGRVKVEVMAERLHAVNPSCDVRTRAERFEAFEQVLSGRAETEKIDLIVDAIDSVACKAELLLGASEAKMPIVSSMGAALRFDPTKVVVRRFDKVEGDGLARALRQRFKKLGRYPTGAIPCVYSTEPPATCALRGSLMPVTCTFGMTLAAEAIKRLVKIF